MNDIAERIALLLERGAVNANDKRHAGELVADPASLTQSQRHWLESLAAREGRPFKKIEKQS